MRVILSVIGGVLVLGVAVSYIRAMLGGRIRPHPFSWGLWTVLGAIGLAVSIAGGGGTGVIALATLVAANLCIFVLAIRRRSPEEESVSPWLLLLAVVGVGGWLLSGTPVVAAFGAVGADFIAALPTMRKTWRDPQSEPAKIWAVNACAMALGVAALQRFTLASVMFPAYIVCANTVIAVFACRSKKPLAESLVGNSVGISNRPDYNENMVADSNESDIRLRRASAALTPFVRRWHLQLNPEDLDEMAYAVLQHCDGPELDEAEHTEIERAVNEQLDDFQRLNAFGRPVQGTSSS